MPNLGNGLLPLGLSPYGIGYPEGATVFTGAILTDPASNTSTGSRRIDPKTRDYVLDGSARASGMGDTQQLVLMAVSTARGSSAMLALGHRLDDIDTIGDDISRRVRSILEDALADLVARKLITIVAVVAQVLRPGAVYINLRWRDTTTQTEHKLEI